MPATAAMRVMPARASVAPPLDDALVARPASPVAGGTMYCTTGGAYCWMKQEAGGFGLWQGAGGGKQYAGGFGEF